MILTDSHGIRRDLGPGSGKGQTSAVRMVPVGYHLEPASVSVESRCPICDERMGYGRVACSLRCSRIWWGRQTIR